MKKLNKLIMESDTIVIYHHSVYWEHGEEKIKKCRAEVLMTKRIRVFNARKVYLLMEMILSKNLNLVR